LLQDLGSFLKRLRSAVQSTRVSLKVGPIALPTS
jgi:hypothetical protein